MDAWCGLKINTRKFHSHLVTATTVARSSSFRRPGEKKKKRTLIIGTDDEYDEAMEELELKRDERKKRKSSKGAEGRKSKAFQNATAAAEMNLKERLGGGEKVLSRAGEGKNGMEQLVALVSSSLKLSMVPTQVTCREEKEQEILRHIVKNVRADSSEVVYISGQPGTGKTLTVHRALKKALALREATKLTPFKFVSINALNDLTSAQGLYSLLYAQLTGLKPLLPPKAAKELERTYFNESKRSPLYLVLLVDELDALVGQGRRGQDVMHTLCEWASRKNSRLLLLGIANTMDLKERLQQRTQSRFPLHPIVFRPYNDEEVARILTTRLKSVLGPDKVSDDSPPPLFAPAALELCAKKTANLTGDIRRALHVCYMAVDRLKSKLIDGSEKEITILHMSECLRDLRATPFASLVENASLYEKVFLIAVSKEMSLSGTNEVKFDAVYNRLSLVFAQCNPPMGDPGTTVWENVCNSLTSSHLLKAKSYSERRFRSLSVSIAEPDDIIFYLKGRHETDDNPLIRSAFT